MLGPLVTVLGITLTFPISLAVDVSRNNETFTWQYYVGSFLIFLAFGGIVGLDWKQESQRNNKAIQLSDLSDETGDDLLIS